MQALFFSKNIDWRTESEYRVVFFGDEHYCSIKNSLNRIILGVDFKICYYPAIYEASKDIQISRLFYESGDFVLKNNFLNLP